VWNLLIHSWDISQQEHVVVFQILKDHSSIPWRVFWLLNLHSGYAVGRPEMMLQRQQL
jgi:hypothetical protein